MSHNMCSSKESINQCRTKCAIIMFISNLVPRHVNHFSVILRKKNFQSYFSCCASSAESVPLLSAGGVSSAGLSVLCQCTPVRWLPLLTGRCGAIRPRERPHVTRRTLATSVHVIGNGATGCAHTDDTAFPSPSLSIRIFDK